MQGRYKKYDKDKVTASTNDIILHYFWKPKLLK